MCTLRAGSQSWWCSLLIVVAITMLPNAPPKLVFDCIPVGIDGSDGLIELADAPVSLTADGMLLLRTPICRLLVGGFSHCRLQSVLFLSAWLVGSENHTQCFAVQILIDPFWRLLCCCWR
jgi:hypothetical protein